MIIIKKNKGQVVIFILTILMLVTIVKIISFISKPDIFKNGITGKLREYENEDPKDIQKEIDYFK